VLSIGVVWNDRLGSALVEIVAQSVAVISRVAEHMLRRRHSADQALGNRVVVRWTAGQQNGEEAPPPRQLATLHHARPARLHRSIHPEWLRSLNPMFAADQADIAKDAVIEAFELMTQTQCFPRIA
jgi:hypothetical protein